MLLSKNETVKNFLHQIDELIEGGEAKLNEKREKAAADFPALARKYRAPDYPMPAAYNEMLAFIVEHIERRDKAVKNLKNAHPNKRAELQMLLTEFDEIIEKPSRNWLKLTRRIKKEKSI